MLAAGFAVILLWEAVWNLDNSAWLSSCLLRFEKRFWCRYLCPVGGMNTLFAKLAVGELLAQAAGGGGPGARELGCGSLPAGVPSAGMGAPSGSGGRRLATAALPPCPIAAAGVGVSETPWYRSRPGGSVPGVAAAR